MKLSQLNPEDMIIVDGINCAISVEYLNACEASGDSYDTPKQAFDALMDEIDEAVHEFDKIDDSLILDSLERSQKIMIYARNAIKELAQVIAVCQKINNSTHEWIKKQS